MASIKKIGIIGCGNVGMTTAYTLMVHGLCTEMVLIDVNVKKAESEDLYALLQTARRLGAESAIAQTFGENDGVTSRTAVYKCNCSREYLGEVLISLGEAQMRQIIKEDGAVRVHCHYCNTDYEFTAEDADKLFNGRE